MSDKKSEPAGVSGVDAQSDKQASAAARRDALRSIAAVSGIAVASTWTKPVIESVIIPAHAQTTASFSGSFSGSTTL